MQLAPFSVFPVHTLATITVKQVQDLFDNLDVATSPWLGDMNVDLINDPDSASFNFEGEADEEGQPGTSCRPTADSIQNALTLMAANHPAAFSDILNDNGDAETADTFLQYLALGKIVYG